VQAVAAAWLACGFDAARNTFWRQSHVPAHAELAWLLNCFAPYPMLANATVFKEKPEKLSDVNEGLFTYLVLQATDILLHLLFLKLSILILNGFSLPFSSFPGSDAGISAFCPAQHPQR
jgi:tryptophanyl-tRNA synthetase